MKVDLPGSRGRKSEGSSDGRAGSGAAAALYIALVGIVVLVGVASWLPRARLWGINHLAFYPPAWRIVLLAILGLSLIPRFGRYLYGSALRLYANLGSGVRHRRLAPALISIGATVMFLIFRSSTLLLGDGRLIADNLSHAFTDNSAATAHTARMILLHEPIAKGAFLLYCGAGSLMLPFKASSSAGIAVVSAVLGGLLTFILIRMLTKASISPAMRFWLATLALSSGSIQLMFGYVETYVPLVFFAVLYLASGSILIRRWSGRWIAATLACLLLAVFMHIMGLLLVPSFLLLLALHSGRFRSRRAESWLAIGLAVFIVAGSVMAGTFTRLTRFCLPLVMSGNTVGLFSAEHWVDISNELMLLMPTFPVLVVMGILIRRSGAARNFEYQQVGFNEPTSAFSTRVEWYFAVMLLVPALVFLILFYPRLGMARDWDLFTLTAGGLVMIAMLTLRRGATLVSRSSVGILGPPAVVLSIVMTAAWVGINASETRSVRRYEAILSYDRTHPQYAYETLARHHYCEGRLDKAATAMDLAADVAYNPRLIILLSNYYREMQRPVEAIEMLRRVLRKQPDHEKARNELVMLLYEEGRYDALMEVARWGMLYHPEQPIYHDMYGRMLILGGRTDEGVKVLEACKRLNPHPKALRQIERILKHVKDGRLASPGP
jgi:tetratricopeptide (TPR) repeat protein